ncbi:hypothetical protein [Pseudomonas khavaziana]|uniref:hypothetical protein n=1 Tax=Pseudomonas khavaziana TaxID=2842351 RepID=UPI001C3C954F|nr:hypothetical protein [Pseudomonas khavaziana]MBV4480019.1 hypothetical protein [Pseudomonas khavaziana]
MRGLIAIALLLVAGQAASASEQLIDVQHDSARGVTCWILNNTGISCLPDSSFLQQATQTSEEGRGFQAGLPVAISPLQATPLPQEKGLKL